MLTNKKHTVSKSGQSGHMYTECCNIPAFVKFIATPTSYRLFVKLHRNFYLEKFSTCELFGKNSEKIWSKDS